jgi:hypothetical protein
MLHSAPCESHVDWRRAKNGLISANNCSPGHELAGPWDDLVAWLDANAFRHPAALLAAVETGFAKIHVLAWDEEAKPRRFRRHKV